MKTMDRNLLEAVARMRPRPHAASRGGGDLRGAQGGLDVAKWISDHEIEVAREGPWNGKDYRWVLGECPWNGHTDRSAYIVQFSNGAVAAGCHHDSCQAYGWPEVRQHYEPGCYDVAVHGREEVTSAPFSPPASPPWPEPAEEAYYGLPGRIVRAIEPHTEADPVALLTNLLTMGGNATGRGSYFRVEADTHYPKLFVAHVGRTAKGRKGVSLGHPKRLMGQADPEWANSCIASGLSSGEGIICRVQDREEEEREGDDPPLLADFLGGTPDTPDDKRVLVIEPELAQVLKHMKREGNTLSPVLRQAWDDDPLQTLTKNSPMRATNSHISVIGHITQSELVRYLTETEMANGLANRFLWLLVKRSKELPEGGRLHEVDLSSLVSGLREAVAFGKNAGEITRSGAANEAWREVYGPLSAERPGLFGAVIGRAEAQVMRLATIYAVMDLSKTIDHEHLMAALAVWEYAEDSARYIFGDATGDPVADQIHTALRNVAPDGMTRTQIRDLFGRNKGAARIDQSLALLLGEGRVRMEQHVNTGGRPAEKWFAR
jgi:hypothetical protein